MLVHILLTKKERSYSLRLLYNSLGILTPLKLTVQKLRKSKKQIIPLWQIFLTTS